MKNIKTRKIKGFTLAEVMVTLIVIGVVAALTIPQLITSTNKDKFRTLNKAGFKFAQEMAKSALKDNNLSFAGLCYTGDWKADSNCAANVFEPSLNYVKSCPRGASSNEDCFPYVYNLNGDYGVMDGAGFLLSNGFGISIYRNPPSQNRGFAEVSIDVNGPVNRPNKYGFDVMKVFIEENGDVTLPWYTGVTGTCIDYPNAGWNTPGLSNSGFACLSEYLSNNR